MLHFSVTENPSKVYEETSLEILYQCVSMKLLSHGS